VPVVYTRGESAPARALSVSLQLDPTELRLCSSPATAVHLGAWFSGFTNTSLHVSDDGSGAYTVDVTLLGTFHCAQLAARQMVRQERGGIIIAISSVHAAMPYRGCVPYNAAKAGLNSMVLTMANELSEFRVRVNAVEPGWTDTPSQHTRYSEERLRRGAARLPFGRLATPEEIAKGVAYLASDDAAYITGSILRIDGGFVLPRLEL